MPRYENLENPSGSGEPQSPTPHHGLLKPSAQAQRMSKQGGSATRPRDLFETMYGQKNFTRYFTIKSNEANIAKMNIFKADRAINRYIGDYEKITEDPQTKSLTIEVRTEEQGSKLLQMKELLSEPITVAPHEAHNQSKGVVTCTRLNGYSNEDIVEGLAEEGVILCQRIIRKPKSPNPEPTSTLILTFNKPDLPDRILITTGYKERVRQFIPLPKRCFNCQNYGHSGAKCRKALPTCFRCGEDVEGDHKPETCRQPIKCIHCNEPHTVAARTCSKYIFEKEVLTIKTKEHLSFPEARARANLLLGGNKTYAAAANHKGNTQNNQQRADPNNNIQLADKNTTNISSQLKQPTTKPNPVPQVTPSSTREPTPSTSTAPPSHQERTPITTNQNNQESEPPDPLYNQTNVYNDFEIEMDLDISSSPNSTNIEKTRRNSLPDVTTVTKETGILNQIRKTAKDKKLKERNLKIDPKKILHDKATKHSMPRPRK